MAMAADDRDYNTDRIRARTGYTEKAKFRVSLGDVRVVETASDVVVPTHESLAYERGAVAAPLLVSKKRISEPPASSGVSWWYVLYGAIGATFLIGVVKLSIRMLG